MFDNTSFYARTCEGGLIPCRRELNSNIYHVDGDLVLQPLEALEKVFEDCLPVLEACRGQNITLLSPLPRYLTAGCCGDVEHAPNRSSPNFRSHIVSGLERTKKNIKSLADRAGITCRVVNPLWLLAGPHQLPEAEILRMIDEGWGSEPVHPNPMTYEKLAGVLLEFVTPTEKTTAGGQRGRLLLADVPEWQRPQAALRSKRSASSSKNGPFKYQRKY